MQSDRESRDGWLRMERRRLLAGCRVERYRASGPGGQRRNKVETAARIRHGPTGVTAKAEESRYQSENLDRAVRRLRLAIALEVRAPFDLDSPRVPPELDAQRMPGGRIAIRRDNPAYPIVIAVALDALAAAGGWAQAARALGLTTSQLVRLVESDPAAVRAARGVRRGGRMC